MSDTYLMSDIVPVFRAGLIDREFACILHAFCIKIALVQFRCKSWVLSCLLFFAFTSDLHVTCECNKQQTRSAIGTFSRKMKLRYGDSLPYANGYGHCQTIDSDDESTDSDTLMK